MAAHRYRLWILGVVVTAVLSFGWYYAMHSALEKECGFCGRPLKKDLTVIAEVGGHRRHVCCARCAITEANQEKKPVRYIEVRDYPTGAALNPEKAFFVDASRAKACDHDMMMMDQTKRPQELAFDRCSPGTFAFARKEDADAFIAQNGGTILTLQQLMSEVRF
jgi:hypothetical protein